MAAHTLGLLLCCSILPAQQQTAGADDAGFVKQVHLGLIKARGAGNGRRHLFLRPQGDMVTVLDPWMEYGFINGFEPCGLDRDARQELLKSGPEAWSKQVELLCPKTWNVVDSAGSRPVATGPLKVTLPDICGDKDLAVHATLKKPPRQGAWFLTTMGGAAQRQVLSRAMLQKPKPARLQAPVPPDGLKDATITWFQITEQGRAHWLAEVSGVMFVESMDLDKHGPSRDRGWSAVYFVGDGEPVPLTPLDPHDQEYFGGDFRVVAALDLTGDGFLELVLGTPFAMLLERRADGYRTWGVPFFPPGGC